MDTTGQVRTLKESALPPIRTTVWTLLDTSRPNFHRQGGKTGGPPVHQAEANSPTMISASGQSGAQPRTRLAYSGGELASLLGVSVRSLQRLEDRGLIRSSKALRKKIYSHHEVMRFLGHTSYPGLNLVPRGTKRVDPSSLLQIVNLHQSDARSVVLAADDGGVVTGSESRYQGRFQIVGRWNCRRFDLRLL